MSRKEQSALFAEAKRNKKRQLAKELGQKRKTRTRYNYQDYDEFSEHSDFESSRDDKEKEEEEDFVEPEVEKKPPKKRQKTTINQMINGSIEKQT